MMGRAALSVLILVFLSLSCSQNKYYVIPGTHVYSVTQHNDSIYFSTLRDGIFAFHPDHPESVRRIARRGFLPFRSIVFAKNRLLASSYQDGVYYRANDTMLPFTAAPYPAWSMKVDKNEHVWLAGTRGIRREEDGRFIPFNNMIDARDIAVYDHSVAVAHGRGISLFDTKNGDLVTEYCKGAVCWVVARRDSLLIGGGLNRCLIVASRHARELPLGPKGNILWAVERDAMGFIYCGTQQGLYRIDPAFKTVTCIGFKGRCIKSLCIDDKGRLWVGRFHASGDSRRKE
jgi:hypothetical protein